MKTRLTKLSITNFKAFRHFELDLKGRHLLAHGANGSGKSSLFWALYTFLQSATKNEGEIAKYFTSNGSESLLNFYEQNEDTPATPKITATFRDTNTGNERTYSIGEEIHGTHRIPELLRGNQASDFITYRFFFGFSNFRNSENFNL